MTRRQTTKQSLPSRHDIETVLLNAGIQLTVQARAERFLRTSAPHHRNREWYKLIEELLADAAKRLKGGK